MADSVLELKEDIFEKEVLHSSVPVIVDFWAPWCMPCKMVAPVVKEISVAYAGKCKVAKINVDEAMKIANRFGVMNIPTIIFFKDGKEFARLVGVVSKDNIEGRIEEMLVQEEI